MPTTSYPDAVLLFTTSQWRFLTGRVNSGVETMDWLAAQIDVRLKGTWASDFNSLNMILDKSPNMSFESRGGLVFADPTFPLPPHVQHPVLAQQTPGVLASPLNSPPKLNIPTANAADVPTVPILPIGGQPQVLTPIVGGLLQLAKAVMRPIGARVGQFGGWRAALSSAMAVLGVTQVVDIIDQWVPGLGSDEQEKLAKVLEAIAELEDAGIIHPWAPRPRRDGNPTAGPFYLIIDLIQVQGFYTNFHMSRKGLQRHDEKQDTPKRPRTAGRSKRNQN